MDIYGTTTLNRTVLDLKRSPAFLLGLFFGSIETSDTEDIKFDVETGKPRISPFVSPLVEGKVVESLGYTTNSFSPAYVKDKRVHDPNKAFKRAMGETIGGSQAPINRLQAALVRDIADQQAMLTRRKELMAAEVLRTGAITISGEKYPTVSVNFGRDAALTVALTSGSKWGDSGVSPIKDLETWSLLVFDKSGAAPTDCVMDVAAWQKVRDDATFDKLVDKRRLSDVEQIRYTAMIAAGGVYQGRIGDLKIWLFNGQYIDDAGSSQKFLPTGTVILGSAAIEGVQHHGAIKDIDAGLQPLESFTKSWTQQDPSVRFLLMQSAPLVVPYRPNASFCATVL
ncbi:MAG TPA: major capsid protein [Pseudoxanthomonas sp.]